MGYFGPRQLLKVIRVLMVDFLKKVLVIILIKLSNNVRTGKICAYILCYGVYYIIYYLLIYYWGK